ncbi:hypothetical protein [Neisseria meningitidis]|nr:hypothetical protein [Neisseria meningitidis]
MSTFFQQTAQAMIAKHIDRKRVANGELGQGGIRFQGRWRV